MNARSIDLKRNVGNSRTTRFARKSSHKGKWLIIPILLLFAGFMFMAIAGEILVGNEQIAQLEAIKKNESFVPIAELPDYVPQAFVSIEDHRFYHHFGIDSISLARSLLVDLKTLSFAQGGSTITMQLVKNQFLTQDKSIGRKLKEILMAIQIERLYSKEEILEMYLNTIYFGHGTYGLKEAAQLYFDKNLLGQDTVTLKEAAILAGLPKAPEIYSPIKNPEKASERQAVVLKRMEELGNLTQPEKETAVWKSRFKPIPSHSSAYLHSNSSH
ncbi:penicillin-binding protein [Pueribacillus theae]|uniref:Penicillin-binding protein n=1 Tax=Pueribacillus theae TaxID=2171751 RepID=A0A2U1JQ34_9BACI|nr:transglycosylase domain-containing protein [Pueribacillus theae]PWA07069.1 penicillin-binding protein [Pueribacillus theae]